MIEKCLFCRIAKGELGAHLVHEDEHLVAFLDICPIRPGHTQIIPKEHFNYFEDLPNAVVTSIVLLGQKLAVAMKHRYDVQRVAFLFTGGDIAHAHAHVVPMHEDTDITSRRYILEKRVTFRSTPRASDADLAVTAGELVKSLAEVGGSIPAAS
jgi:histidine triad (HIT) family protein